MQPCKRSPRIHLLDIENNMENPNRAITQLSIYKNKIIVYVSVFILDGFQIKP